MSAIERLIDYGWEIIKGDEVDKRRLEKLLIRARVSYIKPQIGRPVNVRKLTPQQLKALKIIVKPEYKNKGCPAHLIHDNTMNTLLRREIIHRTHGRLFVNSNERIKLLKEVKDEM